MMTISEHSFEENLLTKGGYVLDAGCGADFEFSKYMGKFGMTVISVDPNPCIRKIPISPLIKFIPKAIVSKKSYTKKCKLKIFTHNNAATVIDNQNSDAPHCIFTNDMLIDTITIDDIMQEFGIDIFDLIKFDIEGSEYDILLEIDKPIAKQISVEFHDFRNFNPFYPNNELYYDKLIQNLSTWYRVKKHDENGNYCDSLFVLKDICCA